MKYIFGLVLVICAVVQAAVTPVTISHTIPGAGVQITSSATIKPAWFRVHADNSNSNVVFLVVGTTASTSFIAKLTAGQSFEWRADQVQPRTGSRTINLNSLYLSASVSGDKAHVTYTNASE